MRPSISIRGPFVRTYVDPLPFFQRAAPQQPHRISGIRTCFLYFIFSASSSATFISGAVVLVVVVLLLLLLVILLLRFLFLLLF